MKITFRSDPALFGLLPEPVPARAGLPDWLRNMAPRVTSPLQGRSVRTLKQCPPFVDAMSHGFLIPLPCDVQVDEGRFSWSWPLPPLHLHDHPRAPLSVHLAEQLAGSPLAQGQRSALKFNSYWTVELEPGWSLMAVHPVNRLDLPFRLLSGMVDADHFHDVGINFPALWTDPDFRGVLPRGTPIAQCFPVRRDALELVCEAMSAEQAQAHQALASRILSGPGVYRKHFRVKRGSA